MDMLLIKDQKNYNKTGIRKCWFIHSIEEVFLEVKKNKEFLKGRRPRTFDFKTMYTCLPHPKIKYNVKIAVEEAWTYLKDDVAQDGRRTQASFQNLKSVNQIMDLVNFIVDNMFLLAGDDTIRRQIIGLPMGTNCAPELANLTLYVDESIFIEETIKNKGTQAACRYSLTFRLIDDILSWDDEPPSTDIYGLEWLETTSKDQSVTFLGGKMRILDGRLDISIFDKAAEWDFFVIRYPHFISNVPYHQPSGVFQGQLSHYRVVCNSI